jgi:hypothetical protein
MTPVSCSLPFWGRSLKTDVGCVECQTGELLARTSCLEVRFVCESCHLVFDLADLAPRLSDSEFSKLADMVADRMSNRI